MKKMFFILSLMCSLFLSAGIAPETIVEGRIIEFDTKNVVLLSNNGNRITVSRKDIPKETKVKSGNRIFVVLKSGPIFNKTAEIKKDKKKATQKK